MYPDSLSAACSNDDIIRAVSLDQLSSRAASHTSVSSLGVSQVISECADSDNKLAAGGEDSEEEWIGGDEHAQSELHITRAEDVVV